MRPDLAYDCISGGSHCFVLDYTYDASESEVRSVEITAGGGTVVSTLDGRKRYTYCVVDGEIILAPSAAPSTATPSTASCWFVKSGGV